MTTTDTPPTGTRAHPKRSRALFLFLPLFVLPILAWATRPDEKSMRNQLQAKHPEFFNLLTQKIPPPPYAPPSFTYHDYYLYATYTATFPGTDKVERHAALGMFGQIYVSELK